MNNSSILPFKRSHLDEMILQDCDKEALNLDVFAAVATSPGAIANTYVHKGHILGVHGYYQMWPGVVEIFIVPSIYFFKYPKHILKWSTLEFDKVKNNNSIHRIQTTCLDQHDRRRFLEYFGFKCEGTLKQYTKNREDYKMYAWVRGEQ